MPKLATTLRRSLHAPLTRLRRPRSRRDRGGSPAKLGHALKAPVIISLERLSQQLGQSQAATRRLVRERGVLTVRRDGQTYALTESARRRLGLAPGFELTRSLRPRAWPSLLTMQDERHIDESAAPSSTTRKGNPTP